MASTRRREASAISSTAASNASTLGRGGGRGCLVAGPGRPIVPERMFDPLTPEQLAAVDHLGGPLLVVAGAGSGKTRTLACRGARLVERGIPPERVLLLPFTRRAGREMLGRA